MCHSPVLAADVTPGEVVTAAFKFLNLYAKVSKKRSVSGISGGLASKLAAKEASLSDSLPVSRPRLRPAAQGRAVCGQRGRARAGPAHSSRSCVWCRSGRVQRQGWACCARLAAGMVLLVFFSTPQNGVLTGKPWDVAAGHPAGPCVHAGSEPPGGQPCLHVVTVYQPCPRGPPVLTEAPWASSVFHLPVSVSRGRKGRASSCADLCDQSR